MQRPDRVLGGSSLALLLASESKDGRLCVEWSSPALSEMTSADDAADHAQDALEMLAETPPDEGFAVFDLARTDASGTQHIDRVSGRRFDAEGNRYWIASFEDARSSVATKEERDQLRDRITAGAEAVQRILQVTEVMRAQVTVANALASVPPLLVPVMAQWVTIQVLNAEGDAWAASASAHEAGAFPAEYQRYVGSLLPAQLRGSAHNAVLAGRQPFALVAPVSANDLAMAVPSEAARVLRAMSVGSTLTVPLLAGGAVIGTILLARGTDRPGFRAHDIELARLLGQRVGNAIVSIERTEARRQRAITAQNALLPELPSIPGIDAISVYRPSASYASVGGDWFDMVPLGDGSLGLSIGDVCGHDTGSMGAMASYRWTIHTYLWQERDPGTVLDLLDRQVSSSPQFPQLATAIVARVERSSLDRFALSYTTAGHLPAVVIAPDGRLTTLDDATSWPIGIARAERPRPLGCREFAYGSTLVMFTDGVIERRDAPLSERIDELHTALGSVGDCASIEEIRDVLLRLNEGSLEDDMSFVIARIGPRPALAGAGRVPTRLRDPA